MGAQRAIVTAPDTPNKTTAHGPTQQRPMNEAKALMPIAPPVVVAIFRLSSIARLSTTAIAELNRRALHGAVGTVDATIAF